MKKEKFYKPTLRDQLAVASGKRDNAKIMLQKCVDQLSATTIRLQNVEASSQQLSKAHGDAVKTVQGLIAHHERDTETIAQLTRVITQMMAAGNEINAALQKAKAL